MIRVLGIETSCDETAASVVAADDDGRPEILSNVVLSQIAEHAEEFAADARSMRDDANRLVRENPWATAGIGAAIGLIAGVLLRRR